MPDFNSLEPVSAVLETDRIIGFRNGAAIVAKMSKIAETTLGMLPTSARSTYPNSAQTNVPRGVLNYSSLVGGSSGTNGVFNLSFSGGNFSVNPTGTFTVSGGAVTSITIKTPGEYIGSSPTAPTVSFSASAGLTGASVTLVVDYLVANGERYWTLSSDGRTLIQYQNVAGVATAVTPEISIPTRAALDHEVAEIGAFASEVQQAMAEALTGNEALYASVLAEFANGEQGSIGYIDPAWCFSDTGMTIPATVGGQVLRIKNPVGISALNMEPISTAGTLETAFGKYYIKCDNGEGYRSVGTFNQIVPVYQAVAASINHDVDGRYIFGTTKNTNTRIIIASATNSRFSGDTQGNSTDPVRAWVQSFSSDYSVPEPGPVTVMSHWLDATGYNNVSFEDATVVTSETRKATAWVSGDTITGMRLFVNGGPSVANANSSCEIWGWFFMHNGLPQRPDKVTEWLKQRSRPEMSSYTRTEMIVSDSTGDGTDTVAGDYGREFVQDLAADYFPTKFNDSGVVLQDFNANGDVFRGPIRSGLVQKLKRVLLLGAARAGSGPDYFIGKRHTGLIDDVKRMDRIGTNHGHNLVVTDTVISSHPKRYLYRLGHIITTQEFYRAAFPTAQHWMVRPYPANFAGDVRIDSYVDSVDFAKNRYYPDMALADFYTTFKAEFDAKFAASLVSDWTIGDRIHPSVPTGVNQMVSIVEATLDAMPTTQRITPPILATRAGVQKTEALLPNCDFSEWSGGLPVGWTTWGDGVVTQEGGMVKVTSAGNGGIKCTIPATSLRNQTVTLNLVAEIAESANLASGGVVFLTDGTGTRIGDGRWFNSPYKCWDSLRGFIHFFPVDNTYPTTLTVRIAAASNFGGATGSGTIRIARAVLVAGDEPRDLLGAPSCLPLKVA